jgi:pimeloyl-ACP methyl ester carboxylesterase
MTTMVDLRESKSTTVRLFSISPPIRAAFGLLERTAPGLGARWAEQIWFTLPHAAPSQSAQHASRHAAPAEPGVAFAVTLNGQRVVGHTWGYGPAVYLMHGWAGRAGQFDAFVEPLTARGYRVVSFDAPSHGDSDPGIFGPRSSSILEFVDTLQAVIARHGPAHGLIAHSMGCTAVAVSLCDGLPAERIVLLAPMASPLTYAQQFATVLGFGERTYQRLVARVERRVGAPMHHFDVPELGRAVAMPPTLIVHDRDDVSTPVTDGEAIAEAWRSARLRVTSGLGHTRLLRDPDVVAEVVDFISSR